MYGVALEGGGAKGAFHMGAIKALMENGYEFGAVTGTSIGALNGAIIAQGDAEAGYKMWESINMSTLFDIDEEYYDKLANKDIDKSTLLYFASKIKEVIENKGINTSKMREVIETLVDEEKLRNSPIDFGLVTVSLNDFKPIELFKDQIPKGQINDYLMASANFPGFAPKTIDGKHFADGGLYDNLPLNLLASRGYKEIIAIRTHGVGISQKTKYKDLHIIEITPSEDLGSTFAFDHSLISKNLEMGCYDALRVIKGLVGRHYYIEPLGEDYYLDLFSSMSDELIVKTAQTLGIPINNTKRTLFEIIIPHLAEALDLKGDATYETIFVSLLEVYAEKYFVEKYATYSLNDFLSTIKVKASSKQIAKDVSTSIKLLHSLNLPDKEAQLLKVSKEIFKATEKSITKRIASIV